MSDDQHLLAQINNADRCYWLQMLCKLASPVLQALANQQLRATMPVEGKPGEWEWDEYSRSQFSHLEAFGRLLAGLAPWLETGPDTGAEGELRHAYIELIRKALDMATEPASADFLNFSEGSQPIVDTAYVAEAILRAPNELYAKLEPRVQQNVIKALQMTRSRKPVYNNWLLFSATIEAALFRMGAEWDPMRIDFALKQFQQWYVGDAHYKDGVEFHWDYYNSYVIHPMLVDIIETVGDQYHDWKALKEPIIQRARRYATILERLISPEGTIPVIGRSVTYRTGTMHALSQIALQHRLDETLQPAQVRCALTALMKRMLEAPGTFDEHGWLQIGVCGHQAVLAEEYISTGSLYLSSLIFLPLGLPEQDPFWQGSAPWTAQKIWNGEAIAIDHALYG